MMFEQLEELKKEFETNFMRGTVGNVCVGERETLTLCGVCED